MYVNNNYIIYEKSLSKHFTFICLMFIEAIRRNLCTKDATDSKIQKAVLAFFSGALEMEAEKNGHSEN